MSLDHTGNTSSRVVEKSSLLLLVEKRLELGEDGGVVVKNVLLVLTLFAKETSSVSGIATDLGVLITETLEEDLHKTRSVWGDGGAHVANALGNGSHGGATLVLLLARGVLEARLLEDLVELTEGLAKCGSEAGNDLHGCLNDEPVVLGRLHLVIGLVFAIKILLADVLLLENLEDDLGDLLDWRSGIVTEVGGEDGRTAKLESGSNVAVDVGDGTPIVFMSVVEP